MFRDEVEDREDVVDEKQEFQGIFMKIQYWR